MKRRNRETSDIKISFLLEQTSASKTELKEALEYLIAKPQNQINVVLYNNLLSQLNLVVDQASASGSQNNVKKEEDEPEIHQVYHVNAVFISKLEDLNVKEEPDD